MDFFTWVQGIGSGMSDMFSISIVAALISGILGLVRHYGGVEWMVNAITSRISNRRGAEYGIGLLSGILSAALVNNTIAIIVTCPMAKEIGGRYGIAPKRLASLVDIFACAFLAVMPHDGGMLIITSLAEVSPLEVLKYSFYMFALIIVTCITIQFGLLRTPEAAGGCQEAGRCQSDGASHFVKPDPVQAAGASLPRPFAGCRRREILVYWPKGALPLNTRKETNTHEDPILGARLFSAGRRRLQGAGGPLSDRESPGGGHRRSGGGGYDLRHPRPRGPCGRRRGDRPAHRGTGLLSRGAGGGCVRAPPASPLWPGTWADGP